MNRLETTGLSIVSCCRRGGMIAWRALAKYFETDGEQRAASFAYYAFFALFPLLLLFIMLGSIFIDFREATSRVMTVVEYYVPAIADAPGSRTQVLATIEGVIGSRKRAGAIALAGILWGAMGFVHALVRGVNRAWGTLEYPWWRLPFQNLFVVGIVGSALLLGAFAPLVLDGIESFLFHQHFLPGAKTLSPAFKLARLLIPTLVLFYGFSMLYKFAPRRKTHFSEVWLAGLIVAVGLQCIQYLFVLYAKSFNYFNMFYGTLGGIVAFLMWIYLSGSLIILGGCLCAAASEVNGKKQPDSTNES